VNLWFAILGRNFGSLGIGVTKNLSHTDWTDFTENVLVRSTLNKKFAAELQSFAFIFSGSHCIWALRQCTTSA
jgi:hypothetical protein